MNESVLLRDATVQEIQLELIRRTRFNAFDGERVLASLLEHRDLWLAVLLDRPRLLREYPPCAARKSPAQAVIASRISWPRLCAALATRLAVRRSQGR